MSTCRPDNTQCMLLFSDLPDALDPDAALHLAKTMLLYTPTSLLPPDLREVSEDSSDPEHVSLDKRRGELVGRVGMDDLKRGLRGGIVVDVRNE